MGHEPDDGEPVETMRCSFCNRVQSDVHTLITGPAANICDDCVDTCVDMLADEPEDDAAEDSVAADTTGAVLECALCGASVYSGEATLVSNRGALCPGCVDEVQAAAGNKAEQ